MFCGTIGNDFLSCRGTKSDADLELIDSIDGHFDVLFIPWIITEGERWKARWGATDIQSGEKVFLSKIVLTPELNSILSSTCAPILIIPMIIIE